MADVLTRLQDAIGYECEDVVDEACRLIVNHRALRERAKVIDISTIGGRIKAARAFAGISQAQLAVRWNVSKFWVMDLEKGRQDLPLHKVHSLCIITGVSQKWLLMESDEGGPVIRGYLLRKYISPAWAANERRKKAWAIARDEAAQREAIRKKAAELAKERANVLPKSKRRKRQEYRARRAPLDK